MIADEFFENLDGVANALDNVDARKQIGHIFHLGPFHLKMWGGGGPDNFLTPPNF